MDGIQPYATPSRSLVQPLPANPAALKTPSDYIRAVRRRIWLVLLVGVPLSVASAVWVVRQPSIYQAKAQISIIPPQYDPVLSTLVSSNDGGHRDSEATEKYTANRIGYLKSKALAAIVLRDPAFLQGNLPPEDDAAEMLAANVQTKIIAGSNCVNVSLEGTDPARTAKLLRTLLEVFERRVEAELEEKNDNSRSLAKLSQDTLRNELKAVEEKILEKLKKSKTIGPGGKNIYQSQYENMGTLLSHHQIQLEEYKKQAWFSQLYPKDAVIRPNEQARQGQIERLQETKRKLTAQLEEYRAIMRDFNHDPSVKHTAIKLDHIMDELERLQSLPQQASLDPSQTIVESMREELHSVEEAAKLLLMQLRDSMPDHEEFLSLKDERESKLKRMGVIEEKIWAFEMLAKSQNPPVKIQGEVEEPMSPVRPKRSLQVVLGIILSLGLGVGLVCLLEHLDHSVKVPEHLTIGLTLPLLGVIPRIRRTALTNRGGHLWTPGVPNSVEADAYRNLRASLLGASDRLKPIVTLLVTSAKAGEGKSTTALNLAATCARAGERTLLMDVDLRRPSLGGVFPKEGEEIGLVDVLRGETPWQRTLVHTEIPNLDFLPTGDTREIPVEVLGTLELRQLLIGLASHYDRVILDGPAVLGMADCRMLGRVVDAALLVVRSGAHEMRPLQRAKMMLEQSGVVLAGVVFNGLYEDLENWSSYGTSQVYAAEILSSRSSGTRGTLNSPEDHASLIATVSADG